MVRHAIARPRTSWEAPDVGRPLSGAGRRQADALAERLASPSRLVTRVLSSAALRCRQTVGPTATSLALELEEIDLLMEGGDPLEALALLVAEVGRVQEGAAIVACSHGDVIGGILDTFVPTGVAVDGPLQAPKAVTWELGVAADEIVSARFVAAQRV